MKLTVTNYAGYVLAQVAGPLDASSRTVFREELHPVVAQRGARLILDLAGSPRINSQGLNHLVVLAADAHTHDSRVILCSLQLHISEVLSLTRLNRFFEIAGSVAEAIADRQKQPA